MEIIPSDLHCGSAAEDPDRLVNFKVSNPRASLRYLKSKLGYYALDQSTLPKNQAWIRLNMLTLS